MKAVIMAGGEGIRLRPLTLSASKPMIPVANTPIIEHSINYLKKYGIKDIVISLCYQPADIIEKFKDGSSLGVNIKYSLEVTPLGTAGGVKKGIGGARERTLVVSGDTVTDIPLDRLIEFHEKKKSEFTAALVKSSRPEDYGVAALDSSMHIKSFQEKPDYGTAISDTINTGIYVIEPHIIEEFIDSSEKCDFSLNLIPQLIKNRNRIFGFLSDGYWGDAGSINSYLEVHRDLLDGRADVTLGGNIKSSSMRHILGGPILLADTASISRKANIAGYSVFGHGAAVEKNAFVSESVIHEGSSIHASAVVKGSVIGKNCTIGRGAVIGGGAVIGNNCIIAPETILPSGIKIHPGTIYSGKALHAAYHNPAQAAAEYFLYDELAQRSELRYEVGEMLSDFFNRLKRFNSI